MDDFYQLVQTSSFYVYGSAKGPDRRDYVLLSLAPIKNKQPKQFAEVCYDALKSISGLAILLKEEDTIPAETIHFGAIWSYNEYRDLRSCGNLIDDYEEAKKIDPKQPFQARSGQPEMISFGESSEEFFPTYVRNIINLCIRESLPDSKPEFFLLQQDHFILKSRIAIRLNADISRAEKVELEKSLSWFSPPYLPLYID